MTASKEHLLVFLEILCNDPIKPPAKHSFVLLVCVALSACDGLIALFCYLEMDHEGLAGLLVMVCYLVKRSLQDISQRFYFLAMASFIHNNHMYVQGFLIRDGVNYT